MLQIRSKNSKTFIGCQVHIALLTSKVRVQSCQRWIQVDHACSVISLEIQVVKTVRGIMGSYIIVIPGGMVNTRPRFGTLLRLDVQCKCHLFQYRSRAKTHRPWCLR